MRRVSGLFRHVEAHLVLSIVILCLLLAFATDGFWSLRNLMNILTSYAVVGILVAGLMVVLVSGSIDISFAATASIAQYVMMTVLIRYGGGWLAAFLLSAAVGAALGAINAVLVYFLRASSIIVTIATLNVYYGLLIYFTGGQYIFDLPAWFGEGFALGYIADGTGRQYAISLALICLAAAFLVTYVVMHRTALGQQIYALGGNPDAAMRVGLPVLALRLFAFGYMGLLAGIAALVQAQLGRQVDPTALVGIELDVLAAVVLGGVSLFGGIGTVLGAFLGIALLALIKNGLILLGFSNYWSQAAVGAVILVSVTSYALRGRARVRPAEGEVV